MHRACPIRASGSRPKIRLGSSTASSVPFARASTAVGSGSACGSCTSSCRRWAGLSRWQAHMAKAPRSRCASPGSLHPQKVRHDRSPGDFPSRAGAGDEWCPWSRHDPTRRVHAGRHLHHPRGARGGQDHPQQPDLFPPHSPGGRVRPLCDAPGREPRAHDAAPAGRVVLRRGADSGQADLLKCVSRDARGRLEGPERSYPARDSAAALLDHGRGRPRLGTGDGQHRDGLQGVHSRPARLRSPPTARCSSGRTCGSTTRLPSRPWSMA